MLYINDFLLAIPELFTGITICSLLIMPLSFTLINRENNYIPVISIGTRGLFILSLSAILLLFINNAIYEYTLFNFQFSSTLFIHYTKILITIFALALTIIFPPKVQYEVYVIFSLALFALFVLTSAQDFLSFYLALELQSFGFYILAASKRNSIYSIEAAIKYFVLGALASAITLFGISILYGLYGTTNLADLELLSLVTTDSTLLLGFSFILIGFFFKMGLAPFHSWLPDVYSGTPRFIVSFFALIPKLSLFVLFLRISFIIFPLLFNFTNFLITSVAFLSIIIGTFGALNQTNVLRLIAFSAISNMGIILFPLTTGTLFGLQASFSYLFVYLLLSFNLFILITLINSRNTFLLNHINDFTFLSSRNELSVLVFLTMFSNVGIPPLAGFFTKFLVVFHLLTMHHILSAVFILFMSALSAFYYLRVIRILTSNLDLYFDVVNSYSFSSLFFLFFINLPNFLFLAALNPFFTFTLTFSCNFLV